MNKIAWATLIALLAIAATAWADETITARPPNEFATPVTTIDQGEKVTLRNIDFAAHDVSSTRKSGDGKPLFRSDIVAPGASGPVEGTEYLVTGTYPFVCTIHPGMDATLEVTSAGTPAPRPDPPVVRLKITSNDLQRVVRDGRLKLNVRSTAAEVRLTARAKRRKLGAKTVEFAKQGRRTVALKLSKAGRKALAGRKRARVTVTAAATDAAGQTSKASAARTLR